MPIHDSRVNRATRAGRAARADQASRVARLALTLSLISVLGSCVTGPGIPSASNVDDPAACAALSGPTHCLVRGAMDARVGVDGKPYEIRFELRLPSAWSGRFFYQGGGGNDGIVNLALGRNAGSLGDYGGALARGFAVVTTDAGHQSPSPEFGLDPQARVDNAYRAHERTANTAKSIIAAAWDTQLFNAIAPTDASGNRILSRAFSNDDLNLVVRSVLQACDAQDGLIDGMVQNTRACRFDPSVLQCSGEKSASCLSSPQVDALKKAFAGPKTSRSQDLCVGQPWDPGIATPFWRAWKLGTATTPKPNSNNTLLMSGALGFYFATPPDPKLDTLTLNFDTDPARLEAVSQVFDTYRDVDMNAFRQRGGKFMIIHGTADGIFSSSESVAYFESMAQKQGGFASVDPRTRLISPVSVLLDQRPDSSRGERHIKALDPERTQGIEHGVRDRRQGT